MSELQSKVRPFSSHGLSLKLDPPLIPDDGYQTLTNLVSDIEGTVSVRPGNQRLTNVGSFPTSAGVIHTITRSRTGTIQNPTTATRFIVQGGNIWATDQPLPAAGAGMTFTQVASGVSSSVPYSRQRVGSDDYATGATGKPYKFFACGAAMLKSDGTLNPMRRWGVLPPIFPANPANTNTGTGPPVFDGAETPYTYVVTNYSTVTRAESNPSAYMVSTGTPGITPNGNAIGVQVGGTDDPQVNQLRIYRAGGSFADGLYRLLGTVPNPGQSASTIFLDVFLDQQIASQPLLQTDNDPPIPSTLPIPILGFVSAFNGGSQSGPGVYTMTVEPGFGGDLALVTTGSTMTVRNLGTGFQEFVVVIAADAANSTVSAFLQLTDYPQGNTGIFIDTAAGSPATLVLSAFDSLFVAGDPSNPHVLYKSKTGRPESFGVLEVATGISDAINVGTPADGIQALVEYGGGVVCLNVESIFLVPIFAGVMSTPVRQPAARGLINKTAWCKVSNEIWYLSYDGIYTYTGGSENWMSEPIDPLFKGRSKLDYLPMDLRQGLGTVGSDVITMAWNGQEVLVTYLDTAGNQGRLRYHKALKRWSIDVLREPGVLSASEIQVSCQYVEADTGNVLISKLLLNSQECRLYLDGNGTTDGWVNTATDGYPITFSVTPAAIAAPPPDQRLYSDISLEVSNPGDPVGVSVSYDYSDTPDAVDAFTVPVGAPRRRQPFSLHGSHGVDAYAVSIGMFGPTTQGARLFSISTNYWPRARYTVGQAFDWDDCGYPNEKTFRVLNIELDTGGVTASIILEGDGLVIGTLSINTTLLDRNRIMAVPDNAMCRLIRMVIVPGTGGQVNYYKHSWEFIKEPPAVTFWDSYAITLYDGFSFVKQQWIQYMASTSIIVTYFNDVGAQFFQITLPAHPIPQRSAERFYLPAAVGQVLNKCKTRRITIQSSDGATPFRIYADGSRIEFWACSSDQREGYQQVNFNQLIQPRVA